MLESCKTAPEQEQQIIREALLSMHLEGLSENIRPDTLYTVLKTLFEGSQLKGVRNSVILKINLSVPLNDAENYREHLSKYPGFFNDILFQDHNILARACEEILEMEPHQIGYAHLVFFNTLSRMRLGDQHLSGFSPEQLILRLDQGVSDFLGERDLSDHIPKNVVNGPAMAFRELSKYHTWDFSKLQACSSLTQLTLVQESASRRKFPGMDRKHRGMLLEDELGL